MAEAAVFVLIVGGIMAWRGYRRGAMVSLLGWLPIGAGVAVMGGAARIGWAVPDHFPTAVCAGLVVAAAVYAGVRAVTRPRRLALLKDRADHVIHGVWRSIPDRVAGAFLGVIHSSLLCLAGALAVSGGAFLLAAPAASQPAGGVEAETSHLLGWLRRTSGQVAEIATTTALSHIPRVDTYAVEVTALITILNASPEDQYRLFRKLSLDRLAGLPSVAAAVADEEYRSLIHRVKQGHVTAIYALARHQHTRRLMRCPQIRALANDLAPSELVKDMDGLAPNERSVKRDLSARFGSQ